MVYVNDIGGYIHLDFPLEINLNNREEIKGVVVGEKGVVCVWLNYPLLEGFDALFFLCCFNCFTMLKHTLVPI